MSGSICEIKSNVLRVIIAGILGRHDDTESLNLEAKKRIE